jgi:hypothetical protein
MKLLTKEIRKKLLPLYATENLPAGDAVAVLKLFTPWTSWTWYCVEFDGEDLLWGLADGHCKELGYFSLKELQAIRGPLGLTIERDLHWTPKPLKEIAPELFTTDDSAKGSE